MKVIKMLMVEFDLTRKDDLEALIQLQEFEETCKEAGALKDSAFKTSDGAPIEPPVAQAKAAPAKKAAPTKKEEAPAVKVEDQATTIEEVAVFNQEAETFADVKKTEEVKSEEEKEETAQSVTIEMIKTQISKITTDYGHPERDARVRAAKALMAQFKKADGQTVGKSTELQEADYAAFYTELVKI